MRNLIITWPKTRTLESYIEELAKALAKDKIIGFRVPSKPQHITERCYVVYDGHIRGWSPMVGIERRNDVYDPVKKVRMPAGVFILRRPEWNPIELIEMKGFQGYHYYEDSRDD